jgi:3-oxoacyl-[acyl-carrier-protein] synthase-1
MRPTRTPTTWWPPQARARCAAFDGRPVGRIDYLNPHGTGTPIGDVKEMDAVREVFGDQVPPISSTKSLTGHSLGAAGVQEAIYCLLMMQNGFIAESANIEDLDPAFADLPIVRQRQDGAQLNTVMSNSFGFGGTNGCLIMSRHDR